MRRFLATSAIVQICAACTLVAQNLAAPRLMGAEHFGVAVALLALPLLIQGLAEPIVNGSTIAIQHNVYRHALLRRVWLHMTLCAAAAVVGVAVYAIHRGATPAQLFWLAGFIILAFASTFLRGIAFSAQRHRVLALHYFGALVVTLVALPVLAGAGVAGYLAMMFFVQVSILLILLGDRTVRTDALAVLNAVERADTAFPYLKSYAANLVGRGGQLALGPGMLLCASAQMPAVTLAEFRVVQALTGGIAYLLPVNAALLQSYSAARTFARDTVAGDSTMPRGAMIHVVLAGMVTVGLATLALWTVYPALAELLLKLPVEGSDFRHLIWAAPFYVSVPLIVARLLGAGAELPVTAVSIPMLLLSLGIGYFFGAAAGFLLGSMAFALALAVTAAAWARMTGR